MLSKIIDFFAKRVEHSTQSEHHAEARSEDGDYIISKRKHPRSVGYWCLDTMDDQDTII